MNLKLTFWGIGIFEENLKFCTTVPDEAHFFGKKEALLDQINQFASTREEKDHFPLSQKTVLYLSPLLTGPSFPGTEYYNILSLHKQSVFLLDEWRRKVIFEHFGIKD